MKRITTLALALPLCLALTPQADARTTGPRSYQTTLAQHRSCPKVSPVCTYATDIGVYNATGISFGLSAKMNLRGPVGRLVYGHVGTDAIIKSWRQLSSDSFIAKGTMYGDTRARWTLRADGFGTTLLLHIRGTYTNYANR